MRKSVLIGGLAVAAVCLAGVASAQQARPARGDTDGDGRLSRAEFVERRVSRLTSLDADRDGAVSVEERRAGHIARRAERMTERFDRLDTNRDGVLSREEFQARASEGRHGRRADRMGRRLEARGSVSIEQARTRAGDTFGRLDKDSDGFVTAAERRDERRARRHGGRDHQASPAPAPTE